MSAQPDELAIRKQVLVGRSALLRAQLRSEITSLRARTFVGLPVAGLLSFFAARSGRSSGAGWLAKLGSVLAIARTVMALVARFRK